MVRYEDTSWYFKDAKTSLIHWSQISWRPAAVGSDAQHLGCWLNLTWVVGVVVLVVPTKSQHTQTHNTVFWVPRDILLYHVICHIWNPFKTCIHIRFINVQQLSIILYIIYTCLQYICFCFHFWMCTCICHRYHIEMQYVARYCISYFQVRMQ